MRCVCPMGGERTCPDDCPLAVWAALTPTDRKTQRRPIAERLYKQGFTMEQIATQLGVSQRQISTDLKSLEVTSKLEPRTSKRGRKGEGRPKGSKSPATPGRGRRGNNPKLTPEDEATLVHRHLDDGVSLGQASKEVGLKSDMVARFAVAREQGRREAEPIITPDMLSMTAQEKLDAAIRQHKRKLDVEFEQRVLEEVRRRIDEMILPHWKEKIAQAQKLYHHRRGAMDKATFNKIRRALHPDSRQSISDRVLAEAFDTFMSLEKFLLDEKESPTDFDGLPRSWAEWEKAKRDATAARRKRGSGHSAVTRA